MRRLPLPEAHVPPCNKRQLLPGTAFASSLLLLLPGNQSCSTPQSDLYNELSDSDIGHPKHILDPHAGKNGTLQSRHQTHHSTEVHPPTPFLLTPCSNRCIALTASTKRTNELLYISPPPWNDAHRAGPRFS